MKALASLRRRARFITLACLPVLLLRALTPVGFMPMHDAKGELYLAFCPGIGDTILPPAATADPHRGHHGMHAQGANETGHAGATSREKPAPPQHDVCPYALSAGPALAYTVPDVSAVAPRPPAPPSPDYPSISLPPIERAQSARAPPAPRIA
jgi:hypothetical protein